MQLAKLTGTVGQPTTGAKTRARAVSHRPKPAVELAHHLPAHRRARDVSVPKSHDRRLEPQCGAWDVAEREHAAIEAELVGRA